MGSDVWVYWENPSDPDNWDGFWCFHISSYPYELWKHCYKGHAQDVANMFPIVVLENLIGFLENFKFLRENFAEELIKKYTPAIMTNTISIDFDIKHCKEGLQLAKKKFRSWISFV